MKDFCKYCFNDPVIHNCQKELCVVCEMETKAAKRKMTNADRIRAMTDEELAEFMCHNVSNGTVNCAFCSAEEFCRVGHNGWLEWLKQEVAE